MPFLWAHSLSGLAHIGYFEVLRYYVPELVVGAIVVFGLFVVFVNCRLAIGVFLVAAFLSPTLQFTVGSASSGVWAVTPVLLAILSWRLYAAIKPAA